LACATDQTAAFSDIFASTAFDHISYYSQNLARVKTEIDPEIVCGLRVLLMEPAGSTR
jgi:hypothetical protein